MKLPLLILLLLASLGAAEFKSAKECVAGARVADRKERLGKIVAVDGTMCQAAFDDGTKKWFLFWMLHPAGESKETDDKLVNGVYKCSPALTEIRILGPSEYENVGKRGTYRLQPDRKIVFESGPLSSFTSKLLSGPKIGLNANGGNFFGTTCSLKRN